MQQKGPISSGYESLSGPTMSDHHVVTSRGDEFTHLLKVPQMNTKWEDLPVAGGRRSIVYGKIDLTQIVGMENSGKPAAGPWEPRRSERVRKPTRRFEESWYNGHLQVLGSAVGVNL